jgi:addiction module RelE/StbE family toxin
MDYNESFHTRFKSDLKKLDKSIILEVKTMHLDAICQNPLVNPRLSGKLSHLYSYHFKKNSAEYRIVYEVINGEIIFYYMIAKRENFYNKLTKRAD